MRSDSLEARRPFESSGILCVEESRSTLWPRLLHPPSSRDGVGWVSCVDLANYASFFAAYMNQGIEGQDDTRDMLNRPIKVEDNENMG